MTGPILLQQSWEGGQEEEARQVSATESSLTRSMTHLRWPPSTWRGGASVDETLLGCVSVLEERILTWRASAAWGSRGSSDGQLFLADAIHSERAVQTLDARVLIARFASLP